MYQVSPNTPYRFYLQRAAAFSAAGCWRVAPALQAESPPRAPLVAGLSLRSLPGDQTVVPVGALSEAAEAELQACLQHWPELRRHDRGVQLATLLATKLLQGSTAGGAIQATPGLLLASSRGLTHIWEEAHRRYLQEGRTAPSASPRSTLGALTTIPAKLLGLSAPVLATSITCSGGLAALALGMGLLSLQGGGELLVGGVEAPLTPFTLAQMLALGIVSTRKRTPYSLPWSAALAEEDAAASFVLGEAAAGLYLIAQPREQTPPSHVAEILGLGWAQESPPSLTGVQPLGDALAQAMQQALAGSSLRAKAIDWVLPHATATPQGDAAEHQALLRVFGAELPPVYPAKWLTGHSLGAAGALNAVLALAVLQGQPLPAPPYVLRTPGYSAKLAPPARRVLVNAQGFGGGALSLLLAAPTAETD